MRLAVALSLVLVATGCMHTIGAGRVGGDEVADRLDVGLFRTYAVETVTTGGTILDAHEFERPPGGGWEDAELGPGESAALERAQRDSGRDVATVLRYERAWGLLGLDVFTLFLDDRDVLVGWHRQHLD